MSYLMLRLHEGTWVDASFRCYYSLLPTPSGALGIPRGALAGWGLNANRQAPGRPAPHSLARTKPAVRSGSTRGLPGAHNALLGDSRTSCL